MATGKGVVVTQCVLVFIPGEVSRLGLWQPHGSAEGTWCTADVPRSDRSQPGNNRVLTAVDALLRTNQLLLAAVTHIGVMRGPASYTELRLFVTTANTLAWVKGVPLFAFDAASDVPRDLPHLIASAKVNQPIEPVYPPFHGA